MMFLPKTDTLFAAVPSRQFALKINKTDQIKSTSISSWSRNKRRAVFLSLLWMKEEPPLGQTKEIVPRKKNTRWALFFLISMSPDKVRIERLGWREELLLTNWVKVYRFQTHKSFFVSTENVKGNTFRPPLWLHHLKQIICKFNIFGNILEKPQKSHVPLA